MKWGELRCHLLVTLGMALLTVSCSRSLESPSGTNEPALPECNLNILLELSGDLTEEGYADSLAMMLAVEDLAVRDVPGMDHMNVRLAFHDSEGDPTRAAAILDSLQVIDPPLVIGPSTSQAAAAALPVADHRDLLLLSPTATSPALAVEADNFFRICPDDALQSGALARVMNRQGIANAAILFRDDLYGSEFADVLSDSLALHGIQVEASYGYMPEEMDPMALADSLNDAAFRMRDAPFTEDQRAIVAIGYSELTDVLAAASETFELPLVRWYATDGLAGDPALLADSTASALAYRVRLQASSFIAPESQRALNVNMRLKERLGYNPAPHVLLAYDSVLLAGLAHQELGSEAPTATYLDSLASFASRLQGLSGDCSLKATGDRKSATFGFFTLREDPDGQLEWVLSLRAY